MKRLRRLHLLVGCFVAPLALFLAITGTWQAFRYHKSLKDGSYLAPSAVAALSSVHTNEFHRGRVPTEDCTQLTEPNERHQCTQRRTAALQAAQSAQRRFGAVLLFSGACLALNAITGVWMAFSLKGWRRSAVLMTVLGIVLPALMLFIP